MNDDARSETNVDVDVEVDDIFFECPRCSKGLVVNRGAIGMVVECTECGQMMKVPSRHGEAEGMEPDEGEGPPSEQGAEPATRQRVCGEDEAVIHKASVNLLFQEIAAIQNALDQIVDVLENNLRE